MKVPFWLKIGIAASTRKNAAFQADGGMCHEREALRTVATGRDRPPRAFLVRMRIDLHTLKEESRKQGQRMVGRLVGENG